MNGTQSLYTCLIDALQSTYPQLKVWINRVLHEYRHVNALQRVGNSLHSKWVCRSTRTNPKNINTILQSQLHMFWSSHFGRYKHARFLLYALHPWERHLAITLKAAWLGTWLPHSSTEIMTSAHSKLLGSFHNLFFSLCRARACNDERTFVVTW